MLIKKCLKCGKEFKFYPSSKRKYCSLRCSKIGEKNPNWIGDKIKSRTGLHTWVRRWMPKPTICPRCNERPAYDIANKGVYARDLKNWEWLCRKCHMLSDGRMKNLKNQ